MRIFSSAIVLMILVSILAPVAAAPPEEKMVKVLIGFKDKPDAALVQAYGGQGKYQYSIIPAIAANMPERAINNLRNHPNIAYIEDDIQVHALGEVLPWGVDRIDADIVWGSDGVPQTAIGANTGAGVKIAVIDTGIDSDHPDLYANVKGGINFVSAPAWKPAIPSKWDDDNGHGTHVAGTIAAMDNDIGVIGVAPDASLYGVKVLDRTGGGYLSDVVAGIDWAITSNMDIITMSLGASSSTETMKAACDNAYAAGIVIVAAAGNDYGASVSYPAAYDSVIAVSATDSNDNLASYSNVGPQVELAAPGTSVYSTYKGGAYATLSGTSMATPHVTGVAALVIASNVAEYLDNPDAIRAQLTSTAEDLGPTGFDVSFGYGLVDAENAAPPGTVSPPPEEPPTPTPAGDEMHISDITMSINSKTAGKNTFTWADAAVTIFDGEGIQVVGAQVSGDWSGVTSDSDTGTTPADGTVTLLSDRVKLAEGTFTFTVTDVVLTGWEYNASANAVDSGIIPL